MGKSKLILFILILTLLTSNIIVFSNNSDVDYNSGYSFGLREGKKDGLEVGVSDKLNNTNTRDSVINRNIADYERDNYGKSDQYLLGYRVGYTEGFKESYNQGYQGSGLGPGTDNEESLVIYGAEQFGQIMGRLDGYTAYQANRKNDWEKYLPRDRDLISMFELGKESREYEYGFIEIFTKAYKASFEAAFQVAKLSEKNNSYEEGLKNGDEYAKDIATLNAKKDYLLGLSNDYTREMPSDRKIIDMFNLSNESKEYQDAFLAGFEFGQSTSGGLTLGGYMLYYNDAYREANKEFVTTPDLNGQEGGMEIGRMKGEYAAILDITLKKSNDWIRHKTDDKPIINEYGLSFQSENYSQAFIIGYWDEFMKSYNETYKRLQQDSNTVKTFTEKISIDGKGDIGIPGDDKFLVDIDPGTYYNDVIATINSIPTSHVNPNSERHTQASEVYGLKIMNLAGTFDENKNITIKFKSYGDNVKYGIYKYHYNKWIYIPSVQEGDYLTADININNINALGNIYAVRVDNQLPIFHEVRGHWAKDEIHTYVKREVIYGYPDKTFKPNREISRGEFVTMLSRLYDWYPPFDSKNITMFLDYKDFGYAEKAISYAAYHKIVGGYPDQTFRPQNPISYKEVEIIMARVLKDENFKWDKYAEQLIYEKRYRSKSKDSMNNKITRAEFTFLLHQLNEWQY